MAGKIDRIQLRLETKTPENLLKEIRAKIALGTKTGGIETWQEDAAGFFHSTASDNQWADLARLKPSIGKDKEPPNKPFVEFIIEIREVKIKLTNKSVDAVRGVYLGRWSEMLLSHFHGELQYLYHY